MTVKTNNSRNAIGKPHRKRTVECFSPMIYE